MGSGAGRILIYNLATDAAKPVETLYLTAGSNVGALAFSHDGASLAAGDWAGRLYSTYFSVLHTLLHTLVYYYIFTTYFSVLHTRLGR